MMLYVFALCFLFFFFKQKTAYEMPKWLEFRRVLFRSPPLPLHLLRASGELVELRARDLAMTTDEAQQLLDGLGVELEPHVLSLLIEQTEGWAAGIQIGRASCRERVEKWVVTGAVGGAD